MISFLHCFNRVLVRVCIKTKLLIKTFSLSFSPLVFSLFFFLNSFTENTWKTKQQQNTICTSIIWFAVYFHLVFFFHLNFSILTFLLISWEKSFLFLLNFIYKNVQNMGRGDVFVLCWIILKNAANRHCHNKRWIEEMRRRKVSFLFNRKLVYITRPEVSKKKSDDSWRWRGRMMKKQGVLQHEM